MTRITGPKKDGSNEGFGYMTTEKDAQPLIPEEISSEIIRGITEESTVFTMFRRLPNMSSRTYRMPVLDSLGSASFATTTVDDDVSGSLSENDSLFSGKNDPYTKTVPSQKKTHHMKWSNVWITAEPLAIILPIGEDVLDDADYPIWDEVKPRIIEAFNQEIDSAIIWGQRRPSTWPVGIVPGCFYQEMTVTEGEEENNVDVADDIADVMALIEEQGYTPSGFMSALAFKNQLRKLRNQNDTYIFQERLSSGLPATLHGLPVNFPRNNVFDPEVVKLIVGDMDQVVYSIRQDITFKVFTEGVVQDSVGDILFNLMQNDMVALRVVMRLGWAIPNPIHVLRESRGDSYPFAALLPPNGGT